jgi:predicted RNase H-like nuclease (RuvC/YqgF family)
VTQCSDYSIGKFFVNYHHLKCFGVYHTSNDKIILTSESDKESIDTNNKSKIINDNSTRILSTNQIYEIGQNGPITLVLKKLPQKFSLVKIAAVDWLQNAVRHIQLHYFLLRIIKLLYSEFGA